MTVVPAAWMPRATMKRIIVHWTAGGHQANATDRKHYHVLIEGDGKLIRGDRPINANAKGGPAPQASHTLNCNTESIGVSLCCMRGAKESPFDAGPSPMTEAQWDRLLLVCADLCKAYGIAPEPKTLLSHAEVQSTLNIRQRQKWDYTRLAFDPSITGAKAIGDRLRREVKAAMSKSPAAVAAPPVPRPRPAPVKTAPAVAAPAHVSLTGAEIKANKELLRAKGYSMVGEPDEDMGPRTRAAITAFQTVNDLPITATFDEATRKKLANGGKPMEIAPARAEATEAEIAAKVPEVAAARKTGIMGAVQAVFGFFGAAVYVVKDYAADAVEIIRPVKEVIDDFPGTVWVIAIAAMAGSMWWQARNAALAGADAYRKGERT